MSHATPLLRALAPWRVAAAGIIVLTFAMSLWGHAEAAIGVTVTVNDNVAGNQTDLTIDITLDFDLNFNETITVTLPAGWTVANGDLTGSVSWTALQDVAPTITGNAAARTITTTTTAGQMAALPGLQMAISPGALITNPAAPAAGLTITVDADGGNAQGTSAPFNIVAGAATAAVTGTIQAGANTEGDIVTGGGTIIVTLTGDTWVAAGATFDAQRQNIINGIDSAGAEGTGWDAVVKAGLVVGDVVRTSATVVTVTLPAFAGYNITANETITVTIPGTALTGAAPIVAAPTFNILAASAAVSGTIQAGANAEADIVNGGGTIILTLTNDTWVAAGATFDAQRQNIINGITSAGAEGTGWNTVVRDTLAVGAVVRTSATVVTVTLPAFGGYNITANETITVTVPATAIASAGALTAAPTFTITAALATSAAVTGTIQAGANAEANIVTGGGTIIITLTNDTWVAAGGVFDGQRQNIINGIDSAGAEGTGWDAVVKAGLVVGDVVRSSATVVTVTLPAFAGYNIAANETITVTIPGTALTGAAPIVAAPTFNIVAAAPPPPPTPAGPVACFAGFFSTTGFQPCEPAPAGSFAAGPGAKSATLCAPGSFSSASGAASCTLAPIGSFVSIEGATSATTCVPPSTTEVLGATECVRPGQVSNVSFSTDTYEAGRLVIWTVEFTTSKTGALGPGDTITVTMPGLTMDSGDLGRSGGFSGDATPTTRGSTITLTIDSGSAPASTAGSVRITAWNPTARTISASSLTVVTSKDTIRATATEDVVITPKPGPKLTGLLVLPGDFNILTSSASDIIGVDLVDGQTAYTVDVPAGKRYLVGAESTGNDLTYYIGGEVVSTRLFDPETLRTFDPAVAGPHVTIRVTNTAGASTDYRVTLKAEPLVCSNGGIAVNGSCVCPAGFGGAQCEMPLKTQLAFDRQPSGAVANTALTTQPTVAIQGPNGAVVSGATDTVTLRIKPGTGTAGAVLTATPRAAVAGVATFSDVKIDRAGTGYVLEATSGTLTVGESEPFDVAAGRPTLSTLSLVPTSSSTGFSRIDVPVVRGQLVYEVTVPAFDAATLAPRFNLSATMSDPGAQIGVTAFGLQWAPTSIAFQSGESVTFTGTNSAGTSPTYTVRLRGQARPTLTALALMPLNAAGNLDVNVPFSDYPRAALTGGQTTFTLAVESGRSYRVDARADSGEITYRRGGISFDPTTTRLSAGDIVTIQAVNSAGTSPTYTVIVGALSTSVTNVTISASPLTAGAATTITTTFKATTALVAADTITVKMTGYTFPAGAVTVTGGTGITGTLTGTVTADARDTVVIRGGVVAAATQLTLTFPATNPTAGTVAKAGLTVRTSKDTIPVASSADIVIAAPALTGVRFSPSTTAADAAIALTAEFTTSRALATGNSITLGVTDFVVPTSGLTVSASSGFSTGTTYSVSSTATTITITITGTASANAPLSLTVSGIGLKNPATAKTIAKAGLTVRTTQVTTPVASSTDIVIVAPLTNAAVTLSNTTPGATSVSATVTFTTPSAIPAGGKIKVTLPGFTWPATPVATFTVPSALANTAGFASNVLTVTLNPGVTIPADSIVTFTVTGATNPAAQPARTNVVMRTTTSADQVIAETSSGTLVAIVAALNRLVIEAPSFATVNTAFAQQPIVRVVDATGATVTTATPSITLAKQFGTGSLTCTQTAVTAVAGRATFSGCRFDTAGTLTLTASATGFTSVSREITVQQPVTARRLDFTSTVPTALKVGEKFTVTVAAVAATGVTATNQTGVATLASQGALKGVLMAPFVNGVATFADVSFTRSGGFNLSVTHGTLAAARSGGIPVTADNTPTQLVFTSAPTHEASGVAFTAQPRLEFRNAANQVVTTATGAVTLSLSKSGDTTTSLITTATSTATTGVATFTGVTVSGADANLVLTATATVGGSVLTATSAPFTVYATVAAAASARVSVQVSFQTTTSLTGGQQTTLANAISRSLGVSTTRVVITGIAAGITQEISSGVATGQAAQVNEAGGPVISFGVVDIDAFAEENPAPAGTSLLFGFAFIGRDGAGQDLAASPGLMEFDFTLPAGRVPAGTPTGDLQFVRWTGTEWVLIPTQGTASEDGSYGVAASTTSFDVIALMYAPNLGAITGFNGYSSSGHASAIFGGGSPSLLARAAELRRAYGAWLQHADGAFRLLRVKGPTFLDELFRGDFGNELAAGTPVTLVRESTKPTSSGTPSTETPAAPSAPNADTTTSSGTTHTVLPGETLSKIGARYGVDWKLIAEANGISGPRYAIRDGLALTIPE